MKMLPAGMVNGHPASELFSGYKKVSQPVYADSLEVLVQYYREKLQTLEAVLESLNVLENSREISCLCREVTRTKKALREIFKKK
jgi:hypothetical protein